MTPEDEEQIAAIKALEQQIGPLFGGYPAEVQGAVLADLLALWLAGHVVRGDPAGTAALRAELLEYHLEAVRALIEPAAKLMGTWVDGPH